VGKYHAKGNNIRCSRNGKAAFVDVEDVSCGRLKCTYREWT